MKGKEMWMVPEDEMDFMPIIPLNESDQEDGDGSE